MAKLFVDVSSHDVLPDNGWGDVQLVFLGAVYGYILMIASKMIGDGAEMLEEVPSIKNIVGAVILPILGAVPDGAIVLFSGMGDNAKEELTVGVGALAGSTIMLLTIPWVMSIIAGRVNLDPSGQGAYDKSKDNRLTHDKWSLTQVGVNCDSGVALTAKLMLLTALPYVLIQSAAFGYGCYHKDKAKENCTSEGSFPLIGLVVTMAFFVAYIVFQIRQANDVRAQERAFEVKQNLLLGIKTHGTRKKKSTFWSLYAQDLDKLAKNPDKDLLLSEESLNGVTTLPSSTPKGTLMTPLTGDLESPSHANDLEVFRQLRYLYETLDSDQSGTVDQLELFAAINQWAGHDEPIDQKILVRIFRNTDIDHDQVISFREFVLFVLAFRKKQRVARAEEEAEDGSCPHCEEEEEEQTVSQILQTALITLGVGSIVVLLFSDPLCAVLSEVGKRTGIPAFYISFILAPACSNGSEVYSSFVFASKKTKQSISVSFNTLLGAANMNNTFCLGIFMAIIAFSPTSKGIYWEFAAESIAIVAAEVAMFYFAMKTTHTLRDAWMVLAIYPATIVLVAALEAAGLN